MWASVFGIIFLVMTVSFAPVVYGSGEIDASTVVSSVIDGNTFETTTEGMIKLADVDTTCHDWDNSTGFISSKSILASLIDGKTVYLEIDSLYVTDYFGTGNRTVCVIYIDFNSTHYLNVNQALVEQGFVISNDYENDFNPDDWTRYIKKKNMSEFPSWIILPLLLVGTLMITVYKKKLRQ